MKYKVIVFDLDGVLFDSTEHVADFFMKWFPVLTKKMVHEMWAGNFEEEFKRFREKNKSIEETKEQEHERNRIYSEKKSTLPVHEGMRELLDKLHKKGFIIAVNTAALEKNCLPLLEKAGILDKFDFVATKSLSSTKVEKFKLIAEKYQIKSTEMIFITDTVGDIKDAELANVPTIAVTWGAHDISYFTRESHKNLITVVHTVGELEKLLIHS